MAFEIFSNDELSGLTANLAEGVTAPFLRLAEQVRIIALSYFRSSRRCSIDTIFAARGRQSANSRHHLYPERIVRRTRASKRTRSPRRVEDGGNQIMPHALLAQMHLTRRDERKQ